MQADGKNAEPVKLTLTFANVSDKPIKLATGRMWFGKVKGTIAVGDAQALATRNIVADFDPRVAKMEDFVTIQPKTTWTWPHNLAFPERFPVGGTTTGIHRVLKPETFRIQFSYTYAPETAGSWTGTLESNEVVVKVVPAGGKAP
jgi:hypothetical protein